MTMIRRESYARTGRVFAAVLLVLAVWWHDVVAVIAAAAFLLDFGAEARAGMHTGGKP